jgi:hypothetical protein
MTKHKDNRFFPDDIWTTIRITKDFREWIRIQGDGSSPDDTLKRLINYADIRDVNTRTHGVLNVEEIHRVFARLKILTDDMNQSKKEPEPITQTNPSNMESYRE